jgi:iron uptake system component EfeO
LILNLIIKIKNESVGPQEQVKGERKMSKHELLAPVGAVLMFGASVLGCGSDDSSGGTELKSQATVKAYLSTELENWHAAAVALKAAAPTPDADGWNDTADATAVDKMKTQWALARVAYEKVEGAIAVLFVDYDISTDERYDGFLETEPAPDTDLFDGMGVTGVHAIERILWAGKAPASVVDFESGLTGYVAASFPTNLTEATEFRDGLCTRLVTDIATVQAGFAPAVLDTAAAYRGVVGSMGEQVEKIRLAAEGQDESRYAQHTLADMRANLDGGKNTYNGFSAWLKTKTGGPALDTDIQAGFARVTALYATVSGDALPPVPAGFMPDAPTAAQLATPYGVIFAGLSMDSDPTNQASLVSKMSAAADLLGIAQLQQ